MITSPGNAKVKLLNALRDRKGRREHNLFLVEGIRLVEEAVRSGCLPRFAIFDPALLQDERARRLVQAIPSERRESARPFVVERASDTTSPQGIVAAVEIPRSRPATGNPLLLLDGLRDPGNLGTILRTAEAAGVETVIIGPQTVDPFIPKAVRAGMGAHFRLNLIVAMDREDSARLTDGTRRTAAIPRGGTAFDALDWTKPRTLLLGGEATGGRLAEAIADDFVTIPMANEVESINVASAAAVLLFEAARQRRHSNARQRQGRRG